MYISYLLLVGIIFYAFERDLEQFRVHYMYLPQCMCSNHTLFAGYLCAQDTESQNYLGSELSLKMLQAQAVVRRRLSLGFGAHIRFGADDATLLCKTWKLFYFRFYIRSIRSCTCTMITCKEQKVGVGRA